MVLSDGLALAVLQAAVTCVAIPLAIVTLVIVKRDDLIKTLVGEYVKSKAEWIKSVDHREMRNLKDRMDIIRKTYFFNWFYVFVPTLLLFLSAVSAVSYLERHEQFWEALVVLPFVFGFALLILPAALLVFILTQDAGKTMENELNSARIQLENDLIKIQRNGKP